MAGRAFALALFGGAATYGLFYYFVLSPRVRKRRNSARLSPTAEALVRLGSSSSTHQRSLQVDTADDHDEEDEDEEKVVEVNESGEVLGALYDIAEELARRGSLLSFNFNYMMRSI
jgi:hypothetical protein